MIAALLVAACGPEMATPTPAADKVAAEPSSPTEAPAGETPVSKPTSASEEPAAAGESQPAESDDA